MNPKSRQLYIAPRNMAYKLEFEAVDMIMRDFHTFQRPLFVIIDLRNLRSISIDTEDKTA
ncbi:hypothetical protein H5410_007288 [Solanum commersonii]|uniref:Uncharacterized protein n=1 Tax=Solanum commersonii TaxID=4109 RepID=A0A9J6ABJ4_SOLCO|nr:hypothetical protein H5410_007288 [Solanum commersonii]